jgi:chromosome segregation ATPase
MVFLPRYQMAYAVYALRSEVKNLDDRTESLERRLRDISRTEDDRLRSAATDAERSRIRKDMDDQRQNIRNELADTDRRLHRKRDELRNAEFDLGNLR